MVPRGFGYIEFLYIDGANKAQEKHAHLIKGKKVYSEYQVLKKFSKKQPISIKHAYERSEANATENCSDRKLSLSDKNLNTPNHLHNDSQSLMDTKKSGIHKGNVNGNGNGKVKCEKNGYDQDQKNLNKNCIEQADSYPTYSKNDQNYHSGYYYGPNYDSYGTHACNEYNYNPYQNENMEQYQDCQNGYEDFYDNSNYYNYYDICYPKFADQHRSLQQSSECAYQDPNLPKYDYFQHSAYYEQQTFSTNDNIYQNVYHNRTNEQGYSNPLKHNNYNEQSYSTNWKYPSYDVYKYISVIVYTSVYEYINVYDDLQNYDENKYYDEGFQRNTR